jgi:pimeloyl-ACP methyl ester carboxylesterase
MPTLVLWGDEDAFLSPEKGAAAAALNPHARVVHIADAGHVPWHDEPERVANEIQTFLGDAPD